MIIFLKNPVALSSFQKVGSPLEIFWILHNVLSVSDTIIPHALCASDITSHLDFKISYIFISLTMLPFSPYLLYFSLCLESPFLYPFLSSPSDFFFFGQLKQASHSLYHLSYWPFHPFNISDQKLLKVLFTLLLSISKYNLSVNPVTLTSKWILNLTTAHSHHF